VRWASGPQQLPPPSTPTDEARRAAEEILSRPEFQEPPRSLYQQALDKLGEWLGKAIDAIVGGGTGSLIAWALIVVAIGLVGYLVVRGVQRGRRRRVDEPAEGVAIDADVDLRRPPGAWDADAVRHEAEGNWREALRCRYRSLLSTLVRAGVLSDAPGRTSGEHRAVVRSVRPELDDPFSVATGLFERAWYGAEPTGPDEAGEFRAVADEVKAGVS
jgi:hypothetical protein